MSSEKRQQDNNIETIASAIEDLLYMGVIRLDNIAGKKDKALFSSEFSVIVSNLMADKPSSNFDENKVSVLMYHSLLIYMNAYLKIPKSLAIAFGNDLEKYGEEMECSTLILNYADILRKFFLEQRKELKK